MKALYAIAVLFLLSCNVDKDKAISSTHPKFTTSDASELFFKNIRQNSYDKEELAAGKMIVNRMIGRSFAHDHPVINLAIVINWRYDESYILIEPNEFFEVLAGIKVVWQNSENRSSGDYLYETGNKESQFLFATNIYTSLLRGDKLFIKKEGVLTPFLVASPEREIFRKTMLDYYRLVDLV